MLPIRPTSAEQPPWTKAFPGVVIGQGELASTTDNNAEADCRNESHNVACILQVSEEPPEPAWKGSVLNSDGGESFMSIELWNEVGIKARM